MKFIPFLLIFITACTSSINTTKNIKTTWEVKKEKPTKYKDYPVFTLNIENFKLALEKGIISIPNINNDINTFIVRESNTMSPELAAKFPNIKAYKGQQQNNELCKTRVEQKNDEISIMVLCNNSTYFIGKDEELNLYIVFTKKNAIGLIKE